MGIVNYVKNSGTILLFIKEGITFMLQPGKNKYISQILNHYQLYLFILPALIYVVIFSYGPMYGVQIAFKDFSAGKGIWGSPWVGFKHFLTFFQSHYFFRLLKNTAGISLYAILAGFPLPIIFALMLNEVENIWYKKIVQTVSYVPHFISTVVMVGMIFIFLNPSYGMVNKLIENVGFESISFMTEAKLFKSIYVWSGIWQSIGWSSIIYFAVLSNVDPQLHEAAIIDGASKLQRIWYINIPVLLPTMAILFILSSGSILSVGFEKIFLMQNLLNMETSDVISTYVYRVGLVDARFSFSSAVGLFNSVINCFILIFVNSFSKRISSYGLW